MVTAISNPRPVSAPKPTLASPLWWKPWPVPSSVNQAIQDSFRTGSTPQEMLGSATKLLLDWRIDQIPRNGDRAVAKFCVGEAFEEDGFEERPELVNILGAVYGDGSEVWLNPVLDEPDLFVARYGVMAHELGGHLAGFFGASGRIPGRLEATWQRSLPRLVDPFALVTATTLLWSSENAGLGAEWELAHRIPFNLRADWINGVWDAMKPHISFLAIESLLERKRYHRKHSNGEDEMHTIGRLNSLFFAYHLLANANLSKDRYIRSMRELRFSSFWAMLVRDLILLESPQGKRNLYVLKSWELMKLGGAVALGLSLWG